MTLEGDELAAGWDDVRPAHYCVLPGREEEECGPARDWDACRDCLERYRCCGPDEDGSMLLSEVTFLPDGKVQWVDKGRL